MIGIIVAMDEELNEVKRHMTSIKFERKFGNTFFIGRINNKKCVLTKCGIGKVNAGRITQLVIDKYNPTYIINTGVAGGISSRTNIGDIVIGEKLVQYDFDLVAFGRKKAELPEIGVFIESNKELVKMSKLTFKQNKNIQVFSGVIASGDKFVTQKKLSEEIVQDFNADCVEMEGASIAQVCYLDHIPFIVIRSISDSPNDNNKIDFDNFLKIASKNVGLFIKEFLN